MGEDLKCGELPITIGMVGGDFYEHLDVGVACLCTPTDIRYEKWKTEVFTALYEGYSQLKSDYESKLAEVATKQGIRIEGENPSINRVKEKRELRKSIIEIMQNRYLGDQDLISFDSDDVPQMDFSTVNLQLNKMDFFESCFEWENISFELYPYFWTGKERWNGIHTEDDSDPIHRNFLQSGAAKIKIPVLPGQEGRVLYYFDFNNIWTDMNNQPPYLESRESLVAIFNQWKDAIQENPSGISVGNPWCVRVPTSLVALRETNGIPTDWISLIPDIEDEEPDAVIEDDVID
ncbi:hypothetical protein ES708_26675 [subsurface metagenome]